MRDRDDLGDQRGGLRGGAPDVGAAVPVGRRHHVLDRVAGPPRWPAWRRSGWPPARRTRCRRSLGTAVRRRVRRRRPARAPSTVRRTPSPPSPARRWRRRRRAVRAWRTTESGLRSAARRAARRRECRHVSGSSVIARPPPAAPSSSASVLAEQPAVDLVVVLARPGRSRRCGWFPGVSDSTGTTPGPLTFRSMRSSQWSAIMPRDCSCGSSTTSATVLIGPLITPASRQRGDDVGGLPLGGPVADDLVQLVLIAAAGNVIGEPVVGGQLRLAHRARTAGGTRCPGWRRSPPSCRRRSDRCSTGRCPPAGCPTGRAPRRRRRSRGSWIPARPDRIRSARRRRPGLRR